MAEPHTFDGDAVEDQAAAWLARMDAEAPTPALQAELAAWRDADPTHQAAYLRLAAVWQRMDRLGALRPADREPADPDLLRRRPALRAGTTNHWAAAAGLAALALLGSGWWAWQGFFADPVFATEVGERRHLQLADTSGVSLNTGSRLAVRFEEKQRTVELSTGEAHFNVHKDAQRPFVVQAGRWQVRAVGTAFSVRLRGEDLEVVVDEGVVAVSRAGARDTAVTANTLSAGHAGVYAAAGQGSRVQTLAPAELERKLAWQGGMVAFSGETLPQAVEEFNRYNRRKLVVADAQLQDLRVGGYFRVDDAEAFARALSASFAIDAIEGERDGAAVIELRARPKS